MAFNLDYGRFFKLVVDGAKNLAKNIDWKLVSNIGSMMSGGSTPAPAVREESAPPKEAPEWKKYLPFILIAAGLILIVVVMKR